MERPRARMVLYMGALVASRRKLLVLLNGMVKSGERWNPPAPRHLTSETVALV